MDRQLLKDKDRKTKLLQTWNLDLYACLEIKKCVLRCGLDFKFIVPWTVVCNMPISIHVGLTFKWLII